MSWFGRKRTDEDFAAEIRSHLELEADEQRSEGKSEWDARRDAKRAFGSVVAAREGFHERWRWMWVERAMRDLRYGLRSLWASPGFAITAIVTLALGMGANTAVFSVMHAVLMARLPVEDPKRVMYLRTSGNPGRTGTIDTHETFSYPVYDALRKAGGGLSPVMAYVPLSGNKVAVRIGAQPEEAEGDMVSGSFFSGLGVKLPKGRGFTEDDESQRAAVAVISYRYWEHRFAHDEQVLGKTLYVNGIPLTIVGVAAEGFEGLESGSSTDFWIPMQSRPELNAWGNPIQDGKTYVTNQTWWCLRLIGRLRPGVDARQAVAELQTVFQQAAYIGLGAPNKGEVRPTLSLQEARGFPGYADQYGKPLRLLMGMVALVLLIALTNVVMLLMARNATRQREFSMKLALGAGRGDLLRQLLTESVLLVVAGGALAWGFAVAGTRALGAWAQIESSLAPDGMVMAFSLAVLAIAAMLFGLMPLRIAMAAGPLLAVKTKSGTADAGKSRMGRAIVALQMMLCVVLLVGAGLLIRSLRNLEETPLGMKVDGLVVFGVNPTFHSLEEGRAFYRQLMMKMRALPGVESAAVMEERLGSWWSDNGAMMVDGKFPDAGNGSTGGSIIVRSNVVGPDFFTTLGVPVLMGRDFRDSDTESSPHVGIINEEFARRFLPNTNAVGHTIGTGDGQYTMTVVGVVKNHKYRSIDEEPIPMAWYEYSQIPIVGKMDVELRVKGDPLAALPEARRAVQELNENLPLIQPMTQRAQYDTTISNQMLFARLAGVFGLLAVVLVATGLYGVLAYRVNMRTAEIGVRMALGARRGQIVWMILRDSLALTVVGVAMGVPLAMGLGHGLESVLFGVKALDAMSYAIAVMGVALVALVASAVPAGRAAGVEPLVALRSE